MLYQITVCYISRLARYATPQVHLNDYTDNPTPLLYW